MRSDIQKMIERREHVLDRVKELLITALKLDLSKDDLDPDTPLFATGLGLDSVDAVVIIVDLESEIGITLTEDESMLALRTINSLVDVVIKKKINETDD